MSIIRTDRPRPSKYFQMERRLKNKYTPKAEKREISEKLRERDEYLSTINTCQVWMCEQENDEEKYKIESKGITEKTRPMLVSMCHGDNITVYPLTTSENATTRCKIYHRMWDGTGICLTEQLKAFSRVKFWYYMKTIDFAELSEINDQYVRELLKGQGPQLKEVSTRPHVINFDDSKLIINTGKREYRKDVVRYIVDNWSVYPMDILLSNCKGLTKHDIYNIANANFGAI